MVASEVSEVEVRCFEGGGVVYPFREPDGCSAKTDMTRERRAAKGRGSSDSRKIVMGMGGRWSVNGVARQLRDGDQCRRCEVRGASERSGEVRRVKMPYDVRVFE